MASLLIILLILQGLLVSVDEFVFHHRRGLPTWEKVGHPLDTLTYFVCLLFLRMPTTDSNLNIYLGLVLFSSVFITKDEFVHKPICTAQEQWLHSLLFILHPIVLLAFGFVWYRNTENFGQILNLTSTVVLGFLIYQAIYWNFLWKPTAQKMK